VSSKSLQTQSLLDLIDLFEQSGQPIANGDGQPLRGVPGWSVRGRTSLTPKLLEQWTECVGYAGCYPAPLGDEYTLVDIKEDPDPSLYRYRCPETFRVKHIPADTVVVRAVNATKFLNYLADLLDVPQALRGGITAAAIDGVLWRLGKTRVGHVHLDVWLIRGLATRTDDVFRHFEQATQPDMGIIFTLGPALPTAVRPPRNYRVIPFSHVLAGHISNPRIDTDLLHRLMLAAPGVAIEHSPAVRFDEFTSTLYITTRSIEPWKVSGPKQAAVVKYLAEQFAKGRQRVTAGDILVEAHGSREAARGKRVPSIFSGNSQWLDYIEHDDAGYGIKLE